MPLKYAGEIKSHQSLRNVGWGHPPGRRQALSLGVILTSLHLKVIVKLMGIFKSLKRRLVAFKDCNFSISNSTNSLNPIARKVTRKELANFLFDKMIINNPLRETLDKYCIDKSLNISLVSKEIQVMLMVSLETSFAIPSIRRHYGAHLEEIQKEYLKCCDLNTTKEFIIFQNSKGEEYQKIFNNAEKTNFDISEQVADLIAYNCNVQDDRLFKFLVSTMWTNSIKINEHFLNEFTIKEDN